MATIIKFSESEEELQQILKLQEANHLDYLSEETKKSDGFVTVKHDIDLLKKMNDEAKQIIAVDNGVVVGYALVMLKEFSKMIPLLTPMFNMFSELSFKDKPLVDYRYYVMGQICIAEIHRGQGIFEQLYLKHKEVYSDRFDFCLTEVSQSNSRSMKAHLKIGFETIHSFQDENDYWNIILWNWMK